MLEAIVTLNSGATAPGTTFAYEPWADTGNGLLKIRNSTNTGWITVGTLASTYLGLASLAAANTWAANQDLAGYSLVDPVLQDFAEEWASKSSSSNVLTLDYEDGPNFSTTLTENVTTLTLSNWPGSGVLGMMTLEITQDSGSAYTVDFGSVDFGDEGAPDLSTLDSVTMVVLWTVDGGTTTYGSAQWQKTS